MAGLFQGDPLPDVTTTTETQATAPEFYTNYLQDIANLGQNAVQQGGVAGFSPLQQQAFQMVPDVAFSGAGSLGASSQLLGQAGATTVPDVVADYMNPYTRGVVNEMGRLQQRSIQENILPNLGAAAAGSGQFGSRRQAQVTGNALRDLQSDLLGKQMQALQQGYTEAGKFAQADLSRALQAGQGFTQLGQEQQQLGLGGLKAMSEYGGQQQALGQKMLDYPMAQTQAFSQLMRGYQIPTGQVTQKVGPEAGAYSNSPLSQIAGLLAGLGSFARGTGQKDGGAVMMKKGGAARGSKARAYLARGGSVSKFMGKGYGDGGSLFIQKGPAKQMTQKEIDEILEASKPKPARNMTEQDVAIIREASKPRPAMIPEEEMRRLFQTKPLNGGE